MSQNQNIQIRQSAANDPEKYGTVSAKSLISVNGKRVKSLFQNDFTSLNNSQLASAFLNGRDDDNKNEAGNPDFIASSVTFNYQLAIQADQPGSRADDLPHINGSPNISFPSNAVSSGDNGAIEINLESGSDSTVVTQNKSGGFGNNAEEGTVRSRNNTITDFQKLAKKYEGN